MRGSRTRRRGAGARAGLALAALIAVAFAAVGAAAEEDRVQVLYPAGACDSGVIEIEVFDREGGRWVPHPEHWRVPSDSCQEEEAGRLLQEIRYRCVDPDVPARSSDWQVGVDVFDVVAGTRCGAQGGA